MLLTVLRRWSRCGSCVALSFILWGASRFKVFPCSLSSRFFVPFSIFITSLWEEGAGLCVSRAFVCSFVRVSLLLLLLLFVCLFCLFVCLFFFCCFFFFFLLVLGVGCGLWLWHSLDCSINFLLNIWQNISLSTKLKTAEINHCSKTESQGAKRCNGHLEDFNRRK